jgi:hypothetical protein
MQQVRLTHSGKTARAIGGPACANVSDVAGGSAGTVQMSKSFTPQTAVFAPMQQWRSL